MKTYDKRVVVKESDSYLPVFADASRRNPGIESVDSMLTLMMGSQFVPLVAMGVAACLFKEVPAPAVALGYAPYVFVMAQLPKIAETVKDKFNMTANKARDVVYKFNSMAVGASAAFMAWATSAGSRLGLDPGLAETAPSLAGVFIATAVASHLYSKLHNTVVSNYSAGRIAAEMMKEGNKKYVHRREISKGEGPYLPTLSNS